VNYLLQSLRVAKVEGSPVLCVHVSALHTLEHYVLARYFYYVCILYQKTRCVIEALLQEIARRLIAMGHLPSWDSISSGFLERSFCWFDDIAVVETMRRVVRERLADEDLCKAIMILLDRDRESLPRVICEEHVTDSNSEDFEPIFVQGEGNAVVRAALDNMSTPEFAVLEQCLPDGNNADVKKVLEVLTSDPEPIRIFETEPYTVPEGTPKVPATTRDGQSGHVLLLESLSNSLVGIGKLAGQRTRIVRHYHL